MKAEHRKELQTNSLADLLGRTVRKVRTGGGGFSWFKAALVLFVVLFVVVWFWRRSIVARNDAEAWAKLEYNDLRSLIELTKDADTKQAKAAKFTLWYGQLWDTVNSIGRPETGLMSVLTSLQGNVDKDGRERPGLMQIFLQLAEECKDEPGRVAEAKYHLAICLESMAVFKSDYLDKAKDTLDEASKGDLGATPFGMMAKKRLDQYSNPMEMTAIANFYKEIRTRNNLESPRK